MSCTNAMMWWCLLLVSGVALAADMLDATCEPEKSELQADAQYADELTADELGLQFMQRRSAATRIQQSEEKGDKYEKVGDGSCLDLTNSHGSAEMKPTQTTKTDCEKECSKDDDCTGYDNREEGCVLYKVAIHKSSETTSDYKCYKKAKSHGKTFFVEDEVGKDAADSTKVEECTKFMYNPSESMRTYSSVYEDNVTGMVNQSMLQVKYAWQAAQDQEGEYMIMDLGKVTKVKGVLTQARGKKSYQYVKVFEVEFSENGTTWEKIDARFLGSDGMNPIPVEANFPATVKARYIKILPITWNAHIALRAGVMLCEDPESIRTRITVKPDAKVPKPEVCNYVHLNPPESYRTYSSVEWDDISGSGYAQSMLDSPQAWTAREQKEGEYMIMDLGVVSLVRGVLTQSRMDKPWEHVTKYGVEYSSDGVKWTDEGELLTCSNSYDRKREAKFDKMVVARYLKLVVLKWKSKISMRAGAVVCSPN